MRRPAHPGAQARPRIGPGWRRFAEALAVLLASTATVMAQPSDAPTAPLAGDRPGFNAPAAVVGPGVVQLELGWTTSRDGLAGASSAWPQPLLRLGVASWLEVQGSAGDLRAACSFGCPLVRADGMLRVRVLLPSPPRWGTALAVTASTSVPTGSAPDDRRHVTPMLTVHADRPLSARLGLSVNYQWVHAAAPQGRDSRNGLGIGLGYGLASLVPFINVAARPEVVDHRRPWLLEAGTSVLLTPNVQLDAGVSRGLTRAEQDWGIFAGVALRRQPTRR